MLVNRDFAGWNKQASWLMYVRIQNQVHGAYAWINITCALRFWYHVLCFCCSVGWLDGWMDGWLVGWLGGWRDGETDEWRVEDRDGWMS